MREEGAVGKQARHPCSNARADSSPPNYHKRYPRQLGSVFDNLDPTRAPARYRYRGSGTCQKSDRTTWCGMICRVLKLMNWWSHRSVAMRTCQARRNGILQSRITKEKRALLFQALNTVPSHFEIAKRDGTVFTIQDHENHCFLFRISLIFKQ